ncbi:MAG: PKD domain-containing protein [Flavisolibacter sp.]|nr:PKD domain-containing protein [Flavisolibacter sp.]
MRVARTFFILCTVFFSLLCNAQLFVDFTMDKTGGCSPVTINFTNLSSASANAKYSWDFGNGNMSILKNPSAIYLQEKTYTVTLTVTDGNQTATRSKTITVYKKPVVDFSSASAKVCLPAAAQFNSTSTAGDGFINSYQWDFGDGTTQQGYSNQMGHYYYSEQMATVSLTVTNSYGCQASVTKPNIVEILPKIDPQFTIDKSLLCSIEESIQLTNNSTGPGTLMYNWNFGDGTSSSEKSPSHQFNKKGVYPISLTVSNTDGCSVTSFSSSVNAAYFNTDFTNQALCRQINFNSSSYLYPSNSFWQFGDASSTNSFYNTSHTYATAGNYNVTLINTYNNTCNDTVTKIITVQDRVNFNSDITMPPSVCQGSPVSFTEKSTVVPGLMSWDFGDGSSYNTTYNSVSHVYNQPGTYTMKLANTFGTCSETVSKTIVVNPLPKLQGFVVDYGGVCGAPVTVKFKDTTAGATAWQWQMDWYNSFSTQQNAAYNFSSDGYHTAYLTVSNTYGCSSSTSKPVNIFRPNANIYHTYSTSPRGNYDCDSLTIKFAVNSNQTIQSYSWNLANGETSTDATPQASYNKEGIYNVSLKYTTESSCSGTIFYTVRVYGKPKADFRYTVPCGNSLNLQFADNSFFSDYWDWRFGDGGTDYYSTPVHYYRDTGKYMVMFINKIGHCADTTYKEVYANVLPSSVTITKAQTTCDGTRGEVTFDQRSLRASGGMWDFGDGITMPYDSGAHVVKHTYTTSGTYQVRLTSYYNGCTLTSTQTVRVLLKQTPLLTASPSQICANGSVNIQISNLQTNPYAGNVEYGQYYVDKLEYNDGTPFTGSGYDYYSWKYTNFSGTLRNFTAGTSQFKAIIRTGNNTCADTSNFVNVLVNGPKPGFTLQSSDLCYKSEFVFRDTSKSSTATALATWFWDFGDGTTQTSNSSSTVKHVYKNPGSYTVRLTVTDVSGCSSSFTKTVNARGAKASFTATGLYVPNVPLNTTVNFYNSSYGWSSGSIDYKWIYGDGGTSTNYTGSHTYTQAGTYTVYLIATDPATSCSDTAKQVINVKDFQTAFAFSSSFIGSNSCPPVMLRINNLSVGYYRLKWDFGDGTSSVQPFPTHIYYQPGIYKITLTTYGYNGLTGTYIDSIEVKQPSAQISADILQGCTSQMITLQSSVTHSNSHIWDFGDGIVASGATALSHVYNYAGVYNPKLIAKDNNGCTASTELSEKIIIDSLNIAIKGIPSLVCDSALIYFTPDVFNFAESKTGTPLTYQWDFGTGNAADVSDIKNPSFRYNVPGTYKVRFGVTSQYGCRKTTTADIVVNERAHGIITAISEICQDGSVQFTGSANPSGNLQWNWNFANGNTSSQQNPASQIYRSAGTYVVSMVVNKNGCLDTATHILTVNAKPAINASPKQQVVCFGDSIRLSSAGGGTYLWSPSTGLSNAAIANPMATPVISTKYKVQVTSDKGCVNSDSISLTIAPRIKVQLPASADLCIGSSLQLNASGAASYQWINTTSGLSNTAISNPILTTSNTATYTIVGSDNYNCFKDTVSIMVTVRNRPTVNAGPDLTIVGGIPYQLNATASDDVVSWLWSPGNNLSCTNCPAPIATPKMQTAYVVKVTNTWGCTASDTVLVKLQCAIANVHIPNAFTPNNNGKNDIFYAKGSGVNVIKHFKIYNRWGQVVFERNNIGIDDRSAGWDGKYKGQYAEAGTYVYMAEMECISGEVFTFKGTVTLIR